MARMTTIGSCVSDTNDVFSRMRTIEVSMTTIANDNTNSNISSDEFWEWHTGKTLVDEASASLDNVRSDEFWEWHTDKTHASASLDDVSSDEFWEWHTDK